MAQPIPGLETLTLPPLPDQGPFPYQLDVPTDWQVQTDPQVPGLWIGPPGSHPSEGGGVIYVRFSPVDLSDPAQVAEAIRANATEAADWSAPRVEVLDLGTDRAPISGVWIEMVRSERITLVVKAPMGAQSVDFLASAAPAEMEDLRSLFTQVLESIRPVGAPAEPPAVED